MKKANMVAKRTGKMVLALALLITVLLSIALPASAASLKNGSKGTAVRYLQYNLNGLGYSCVTVDGKLGSKTVAAIKAYERENGRTVDGIASDSMQTLLKNEVKSIQEKLIKLGYDPGEVDGIFGSATQKAVKLFQKTQGIKVTGVANGNTLSNLNKAVGKLLNTKFTIKFSIGNGYTMSSVKAKSGQYRLPFVSELANAKINGKVFCGWSTNKNATQADYIFGNLVHMSGNITLYGVWSKYRYNATKSNVEEYSRDSDGGLKLAANFKVSEFASKGTDYQRIVKIDNRLVALLQDIRDAFGKSVTINSGYRTPEHNANVANAAKESKHTLGMAADISVRGVNPLEVARFAEKIGVKGIGYYDRNNGYFVHVDTRTDKFYWKTQNVIKVSSFK